jgi:glycosyltransferase involved in cell wall biosynthesis
MAGISVIVPTYNRASLIGETLESILRQTRPADEVIVVDDGSTDDTQQIIATYAGRVTVLHRCNTGPLVARNHGLRAAQGNLVAFCDSDDLWQPDYLANMERLFQVESGLGVAYGNFRLLQDGRLAETTKFDDAPDDFWYGLRAVSPEAGVFDMSVTPRLIMFQPFFPSAMVVDRAAFLRFGGWDEAATGIVGSDFATTLRIVGIPPVGVLRCPLVSIRKHTANISGDSAKMNQGNALILERMLEKYPELEPYRSLIEHSILTRRMDALDGYYGRMDFAQVKAIDRLISGKTKPLRLQAKTLIARLPLPLARLVARALDPSRRR